MYYVPVKLSDLPIGRLNNGLKIISFSGLIGIVSSVEYKNADFILTIDWENDSQSIQSAENLRQVYAMVYDAGITKLQSEAINKFNQS